MKLYLLIHCNQFVDFLTPLKREVLGVYTSRDEAYKHCGRLCAESELNNQIFISTVQEIELDAEPLQTQIVSRSLLERKAWQTHHAFCACPQRLTKGKNNEG